MQFDKLSKLLEGMENASKKDYPIVNLYRLMYMPEIWYDLTIGSIMNGELLKSNWKAVCDESCKHGLGVRQGYSILVWNHLPYPIEFR